MGRCGQRTAPQPFYIAYLLSKGSGADVFDTNSRKPRNDRPTPPSLEWDTIQRTLNTADSQGDLLLILDCCYAAQAGRGPTILAACAMGLTTPLVGESSFTSRLIAQTKELLEDEGFVSISQLHGRLTKRHAKLDQTPVVIDLSDNAKSTPLILRPLSTMGVQRKLDEPSSLINLTLHVGQIVCISEFTDWLKNTAPPAIEGIYCTGFRYYKSPELSLNTNDSMGIGPSVGSPRTSSMLRSDLWRICYFFCYFCVLSELVKQYLDQRLPRLKENWFLFYMPSFVLSLLLVFFRPATRSPPPSRHLPYFHVGFPLRLPPCYCPYLYILRTNPRGDITGCAIYSRASPPSAA